MRTPIKCLLYALGPSPPGPHDIHISCTWHFIPVRLEPKKLDIYDNETLQRSRVFESPGISLCKSHEHASSKFLTRGLTNGPLNHTHDADLLEV